MIRSSLALLALLLCSAPAWSQSRVYTNADLGKPISWATPAPSAEQLESLAARQFVAPGPRNHAPGPLSARTGSRGPTLGPWDWPEPTLARRLDGSLLSDAPWQMTSYPYWYGYPAPGRARQHSHPRQ